MKMTKEEAEKFADALKDYVVAILRDETADAGDSQSGYAEYREKPHFIKALMGEVEAEEKE